ncbi:hypothetical protein NP493_1048g00055 [Ridgeia piscesae]|uniref:LysM domain-containing protein n=1 Tax=Ridgeia piscesae TaxID=27915 RepID=A0AAD9NKI7_RIDPI|nr:hypothetical protein NP493_1048g00055 [Ridgeia piscesae]
MEGRPTVTDQKAVLKNLRKVKLISQPKGTILYSVSSSDTLASIAAKFDTTTSELMKLNKLMSQMIFPGQMLYVPDKDYVVSAPTSPVTTTSQTFPPSDPPSSPTFLVGSPVRSPMKLPGHAERQDGPPLPVDPPHPLSEEEVKRLDEECYERFIKVNVKHITDGQGVVSGVLLVTPNAIMFDPNVSDTLVIEHGADAYGMIAPMETVISAAMYHDIAAMRLKGASSTDQAPNTPRPEVYHMKGCHPVAPSGDSAVTEMSAPDAENSKETSNDLRGLQDKSDRRDSGCSCDAALEDAAVAPPCDDEELPDVFADILIDDTRPDDKVTPAETISANVEAEITPAGVHSESETTAVGEAGDSQGSRLECVQDSDRSAASKPGNCDLLLEGEGEVTKGEVTKGEVTKGEVTKGGVVECEGESHIIPVDNVNKADSNMHEAPPDGTGAAVITGQAEDQAKVSETEEVMTSNSQPLSEASPVAIGNNGSPDNVVVGTPNLQIGNIQYFQFDDVTFAIPTTNPESKDTARHDSETVGSVDSHGSGSILSRTLGSFSSFSSLSPNFNIFVDFSSGLFAKNQEYRGPVKDLAGELSPVYEAASTATGPRHDSMDVRVRNAVRLADKPDLFRSLDELIPRPATLYEDPPLYLCLKIGRPLNKAVSKTCPIESYTKRHKPEYWFSIPRDKVDHLYAFFVQWSPNIYGNEEDIDCRERGFVVIEDTEEGGEGEGEGGEEGETGTTLEEAMESKRPKLARQMTKDWEVRNTGIMCYYIMYSIDFTNTKARISDLICLVQKITN